MESLKRRFIFISLIFILNNHIAFVFFILMGFGKLMPQFCLTNLVLTVKPNIINKEHRQVFGVNRGNTTQWLA